MSEGFFVAPLPSMPEPTSTRLGMAHHAARADASRTVYRALYGAAAGDLVEAGITCHSLPVVAGQAAVVEPSSSWSSPSTKSTGFCWSRPAAAPGQYRRCAASPDG